MDKGILNPSSAEECFKDALNAMKPAMEAGVFLSELVAFAKAGEKLGEIYVPEGKVGFATICSVVINGVLLKNGVPVDSKFGGILQIKNEEPFRFVELIYYSGTSLDPSEAFIRSKMTSVREAAQKGEGKILANFREIPASSRDLVKKIVAKLKKAGIDGVLSTGEVSEMVCQIPVDVNKVGMILVGGLNPVACAEEVNIETESHAMSTLMDYEELKNFREVYY